MKKLLVPTLIIFLAATALGHSASARSAEPTRGAPPDWVIHHPVPSDVDTDPQTLLGGFHWLLIDRQMNITTEEEYSHFAIRVTNGDGVQNMSDISIDFDPSYQTLVFHSVRLHRNGRVIDNLADHDIQTFQRETGMDQNLYDGSETAVINQENVRIGDIIEYSFTRTGINPIHEGDYFGQEYFQYSLPIHQFHIRLLSARDHPLYFTFRNGAPEPDRTERDGLVEYTWDIAEVPAHLMDDDAPFWYDPYPSVWISSLEDWSGVVGWALDRKSVV